MGHDELNLLATFAEAESHPPLGRAVIGGLLFATVVPLWRPSRLTIWARGLSAFVLLVVAFFAGYLPLHHQDAPIAGEAQQREHALPRVAVVTVGRSSHDSALQLPGNIQAMTEAPLLARADGYVNANGHAAYLPERTPDVCKLCSSWRCGLAHCLKLAGENI